MIMLEFNDGHIGTCACRWWDREIGDRFEVRVVQRRRVGQLANSLKGIATTIYRITIQDIDDFQMIF